MSVESFTNSFGLRCIAYGVAPNEVLMLTMHTDDDPPSILIAYAKCRACDRDAAGDKALAAIRDAIGVKEGL